MINYTLDGETDGAPQLLLFTKADLEDLEEEDCQDKLSRASFTCKPRVDYSPYMSLLEEVVGFSHVIVMHNHKTGLPVI